MSKPKIAIVGQLQYSEAEGLRCLIPISIGSPPRELTTWLEALPNTSEWPGIPKMKDEQAYTKRLHAAPSYKQAAKEFLERQRRDPQRLWWGDFRAESWAYKDKILTRTSDEPESDMERTALLVKHYVLSREREFDRIQREIEALENLEKLESVSREPISESVRLFVWQRDKGQCVKCGSREGLEFDHIIPVALGGGNTERNIQLLCEPCNRSKGATV